MKMKSVVMVKTVILLFAIIFAPQLTIAQIDPIDKNGIAIDGYDVVAYFNAGKAIKGDQQNKTQFNGTQYYFSSKSNQALFEAEPSKYLPQYDGYCALGITYGRKISINPNTFKVTGGKLYLFFNGTISSRTINYMDPWLKDEPDLLKKADELWPHVKKKKYKLEN